MESPSWAFFAEKTELNADRSEVIASAEMTMSYFPEATVPAPSISSAPSTAFFANAAASKPSFTSSNSKLFSLLSPSRTTASE